MSEFKFPKDKTAIVLIEPQNDFLTEGGTMYAHIKEQLADRHVIANLQNLLDGARKAGIKIFYCPFHPFDAGFPELKKGGPGCEGLRGLEMDMEADWGTGAWLRGTPGPEIIKELTPQKGEKHKQPTFSTCYGCHHMENFQKCSSSGCHEEGAPSKKK